MSPTIHKSYRKYYQLFTQAKMQKTCLILKFLTDTVNY